MKQSELVTEMSFLETLRQKKTDRKIDLTNLKRQNILTFDLETIPAATWNYQLKTSYIPHKSILAPGGLLGFSYKWFDEDEAHWIDYRFGYQSMVAELRALLNAADFAITYNGDRFDLPKSRGYIARAGLDPYAPPRSIDLLKTSKSMGWESASLDYSCRMMGVRRKVDNGGAGNWLGCVMGDPDAWEAMETYGIGDTLAEEELFIAFIPWLKNPPHLGHYIEGEAICPRCSGEPDADVFISGDYHANNTRYKLFKCSNCGGYYRATRKGIVKPTAGVS